MSLKLDVLRTYSVALLVSFGAIDAAELEIPIPIIVNAAINRPILCSDS